MGYYEVLEEIERLEKDKIEVTIIELSNVLPVSERAICGSLSKLVSDGRIERTIYYTHGGKLVTYNIKKSDKVEGFINGVFKVVASIIR